RKRRKRTTAGGAADDCFACANARVKCDRRRPYCTQCLERGKGCSGYKTTLTWGVGVASRGKLRGRSLPVSDGQGTSTSPKERRQSTFKSAPVHPHPEQLPAENPPAVVSAESQQWPATSAQPQLASHSAVPLQDHVFDTSAPSATVHIPDGVQHLSSYSFDLHATSTGVSEPSAEAWMHPSGIAPNIQYEANSCNIHADHDQPVPLQWPPTVTGKRPTSPDEDPEVDEFYSTPVYSSSQPSVIIYQADQGQWTLPHGPFANSLPDLLLEQSVGRTPRIRYLISYFAEVIAPVIVAFDSPTNPYRTRILQLAHHSDTLQHAIAALSASNIRQRREEKILSTERTEPARMSSMAHRALTDASFQARYGIKDIGGNNHEEVLHKSVAIRSLNAQLADPSKRHHDSVLATLLILCLFHICETGVAQFQTQFAGVRKLLAMRSRTNAIESEEAKWCTRMFTWFDAMTATINNREGQLQGPLLDMTCFSDEEWALENLAGCDGRLFKIIARLGRLNILAQNQPVDRSYDMDPPTAMPVLPQSISHYTPNGMNAAYAANLYANPQIQSGNAEFWTEWHSIRQQLESWRLDVPSLAPGYDPNTLSPPYSGCSSSSSPTSAPTFTPLPTSPGSNHLVAPKNLIDLSNISEAFRYSALLYTERLAYPDLPSTHPRIQTFVLTAMHYIAAVHSDVYLLWPLFITGSECVYVEHRAAIRNRCRDIQKDSGFYNNISCLELLEKIWAKNPTVQAQDQTLYNNFNGLPGNLVSHLRTQVHNGQAGESAVRHENGFKWQSIIESEGIDGEYIVV
ncbi:fungal-specific transcription factor domain-containing protein, partial [Talaromyces proteolyticus]